MKFLGNPVVFAILYILFMIPTYFFAFIGSNSVIINATGVGMGAGISPLFSYHLAALAILVVITWLRAIHVIKLWIIIFPVLATIFDLTPGLSSIPLIPTVMHLLAIIFGVMGTPQAVAKQ